MAIGETFLSAFLQVLFEKMLSPGVNMFMKLVKGGIQHQKTIKKWEKQLRLIEAVLSDAEHKNQLQSNHNNGVNSWVQNLQDLAYDMEDVLDSLATQALIYELMIIMDDEHGRVLKDYDPKFMVQSIVAGGSKAVEHLSFMLNSDDQNFSVRISEINQQLQDIVSHTKGLGLVMHQQTVLPNNGLIMQGCWRESTSLLSEPCVYGREGDRKEILHQLLHDENNSGSNGNLVVIPIVGKGGIGKTTLAQLVYNDVEVDGVFDVKAWVYVSQVFDAKKITTSIYNTITGESNNSFCDLNQAQVKLKHVLTNKRFLIVLDDIWSEVYSDWDDLRTPLRGGAKGSRVVATMRSQKVARIMSPRLSSMMISLECLSDDDCWHLILQHAFDDANIGLSLNLSSMRDDLTRKCNGVPLVAKALGGLLRTKVEWEEEMVDVDAINIQETRVLQVFELSYHDLPSQLKRCFAYCSIFPYDHVFTEEDVILLWMAEGLLPENNVKNKQMEDIGHEYFSDLVSRSLFERSSKGVEYFKMHNLNAELAQQVAGDLCFAVKECSGWSTWHKISPRARHFSFSYKLDEPNKPLFPSQNVKHFRTFAYFDKHTYPGSSDHVLEVIEKFQYIRVLSLHHMGITTVPESVGNLKLLRYLNLSYNNIEELPGSLSNLVNLQTLLLKGCDKLQKLLTKMRCLINLRHLDIGGTSVQEMPLGIGNLTSLQTLHTFIIGANAPVVITELKTLNSLRGKLSVTGLENVVSPEDAGEAMLHEKSRLQELEMVWEWGTFTNGVDDSTKIDILDQLRPHKSTKVLTLRNYKGVTFPSWLGDPLFAKMVIIRLVGCERVESLPPLGKLPFLKELVVQEMRGLKTVDSEFHGAGCSDSFPALRTLKFKSMTSWECWLQPSADISRFPCLQELLIKDCPSLQQSLPSHLPLLQELEIQNCKDLNTSLPCLPQLQKLLLEDCSSLVAADQLPFSLRQLVISCCQKLQSVEFKESYPDDSEKISLQVLEVVNCKSLSTLLSKHQPISSFELSLFEEGLSPSKLGYLTKLTISECQHLTSFPEDLVLPGLRNLLISVCRNLQSLPKQMHKFTSLQDLILTNCPKICYFPKDGLPVNLKSLYLDGLKIEQPMQEWGLHSLNSLEKLSISDVGCSSSTIDSFPNEKLWLPSSLLGLAISGFSNLNTLSCLEMSNLTFLYMRRCPKLEHLVQNCVPPGLKELWVVQCPALKHQMEQDPLRHTISCITHVRIC